MCLPTTYIMDLYHFFFRSSTNLLELSQMFEQMQSSVIHRDSTVHPKLLGLTSSPTTPEVGIGHVCAKPRKLEPLKHKIPQTRNNLAGLRLPANYSGKWRDWNEPEIFSINELQNWIFRGFSFMFFYQGEKLHIVYVMSWFLSFKNK